MEKLFNDSETITAKRPTTLTSEQEEEMYKNLANEILENSWSSSDKYDIIHDLKYISFRGSGYEIAKELEGFCCKGNYNIDMEFLEFLEELAWKRSEILKETVKKWVEIHKPQSKYEKGQKLIIDKDLNHLKKKGKIIYVTGFRKETASYLVDADSNKKGGTVIPYEKIEECCTPINSNSDEPTKTI